ncbi:MAG TPA: hypothetical protein VHC63_13610 [Acidimicrobiales bacterium]|nr:hypothetical protein [Acidimicrobiales bacterium]
MRKILVAVAALTMVGGAACGGGGSKKATTTTQASGTAPAAVIKAEGTTWTPQEVTVKVGDVVEWDVDGSIVHDLHGDDGITHKAGSKFTVTHVYSKPGTYSYQCSIHAGMNGTVTVTP